MDPKTNYVGAAIFWLYIVAALIFAALIIHTLVEKRQSQASNEQHRRTHVVVFSILAAISFATLSFNMLNVLIRSFNSWSETHPSFTHDNGLLAIWRWSLESTLFHDFAKALVKTDARYLWSEAALLTTFAVSTFMSIEGHRYQLSHLPTFFCLMQILPVSLAQNLFYVALLKHESTASPGIISMQSLRLLKYLTAAYCGCLLVLPIAAESRWLMVLVLLTRMLLFLPLLLPKTRGAEKFEDSKRTQLKVRQDVKIQIVLGVAACIFIQVYAALNSGTTLEMLLWTVFEHPAVSSLGCDMIISVLSALVWVGLKPQPDQQSSKDEDPPRSNKSSRRNPRKSRAA